MDSSDIRSKENTQAALQEYQNNEMKEEIARFAAVATESEAERNDIIAMKYVMDKFAHKSEVVYAAVAELNGKYRIHTDEKFLQKQVDASLWNAISGKSDLFSMT